MGNLLLKTKLHIPKPRPGAVGRIKLLNKLDEGLFSNRPFSLLSAPAGYGKTTLAAAWLERTSWLHAWLALDEQDNDPVRFLSYLIAALQTIDEKIGQETSKLLTGSGITSMQAILATLINEILTTSQPFVLVLDDFHVIRQESIVQFIQALLDQHPAGMHLVVITREDPALSLPRLRVRNQMTEIRMDDLRFDLEETGAFLTASSGIKLKDEQVLVLESRTEGWIAGLQLAALSISGWTADQVDGFIKAFSGNHRYIIDYLMEEVIKSIEPEVYLFITRTAVVDRFNAELGHELTGLGTVRIILNKLEQANLFLISLDNERQWYRYHHLFGEFLRTELAKSEIAEIQHQAAVWFADHGFQEEAIKYALAAGINDLAGQLLKVEAAKVFQKGEVFMLLDWLNSLPAELVDTSEDLIGFKAWSLFLLGRSEEAVQCLQKAEQNSPEKSSPLASGRLLALRGWIANYCEDPRTKEIARSAIDLLSDQDPFFLEMALMSLGHALRKNDPMPESTGILYRAYAAAHDSGHMFTSIGSLLDITMNLVIQGGRKESMELCNQALQDYVDRTGKPLPMVELLYIPLGILLYEGNELGRACECLKKGISAGQRLGLNRILGGDAEQTLALAYMALGDVRAAFAQLEKGKAETDAKAFPVIRTRYEAFEALLLLKQGDLTGAQAWVQRSGLNPSDNITSFKEIPYMVIARILFQLKQYEQALTLLHNIKQFDKERGRYGRLVYVNIVFSIVLQALGRQEEAVEAMEEAVDFAMSEGYVRPFLSEGPEIRELLYVVEAKKPCFITFIRDNFVQPTDQGTIFPASSLHHPDIIESLSGRESEVLHLLAKGLSNEEIGQQLFISNGTVKWHVKNIFSKLEVKSRIQAVGRAQQLGLLRN